MHACIHTDLQAGRGSPWTRLPFCARVGGPEGLQQHWNLEASCKAGARTSDPEIKGPGRDERNPCIDPAQLCPRPVKQTQMKGMPEFCDISARQASIGSGPGASPVHSERDSMAYLRFS